MEFYNSVIKDQSFANKYIIYDNISDMVTKGNITEANHLIYQSKDLIYDNFVKVNVRLGSTSSVHYKDKPSLTLSGLSSSLGGTLSLYCGITVFVLAEVIELFCRCITSKRKMSLVIAVKNNKDSKDNHMKE